MKTNKELLIDMIENEILIDIEDAIDELFAIIAAKEHTPEDESDLKEFQELKKEFDILYIELKEDKLEEEEIIELLKEFKVMQTSIQ